MAGGSVGFLRDVGSEVLPTAIQFLAELNATLAPNENGSSGGGISGGISGGDAISGGGAMSGGSAIGGMNDASHVDHEHVHAHVAILFMFLALTLGAATMHFLSRYCPAMPYTVVILMEGFAVGWIDNKTDHSLGTLSQSFRMWSKIDPHLLLFAFLPALLFADSMGMNWRMWKRCLGQCLLLAGPGVLIGCAATAYVAKNIFPYGWSWNECLMFGSILSATDPVAVVSILKELGAPESLTMIVSGESLLNDGTAIVVFNLFKALALESKSGLKAIGADPAEGVTGYVIAKYFSWMSFGGILLGTVFGVIAVIWLGNAKRKTGHEDAIIQIAVTLCLAYLTFFTAEEFAGVSGVLATVAAALVMASSGWPHFVSRETMGSIWHVIEYIGNTLIFFLAGLILGDTISCRYYRVGVESFVGENLFWLGVLYVSIMVIRSVMVIFMFPFLRKMGLGLSWRDGVMLSWGGLRGALGMTLALDVKLAFADKNPDAGSLMLFHVGGIAICTLLINGVLSGKVLKLLGLTKPDEYREVLLEDVDRRIRQSCQAVFEKEVQLLDLTSEQQAMVVASIHSLSGPHRRLTSLSADSSFVRLITGNTQGGSHSFGDDSEPGSPTAVSRQAGAVRELFLAMLQTEYVDLVDRGVLRSHSQVSTLLYTSIDIAKESAATEELSDWKAVVAQCQSTGRIQRCVDSIAMCHHLIEEVFASAGLTIPQSSICYMLYCFIHAHKQTQASLSEILEGTSDNAGLAKVLWESNAEIAKAEARLEAMDTEMLQCIKVEQLINVVLESQRCFITRLVDDGVLQEKQAHHLMDHVREDQEMSYQQRRDNRRSSLALDPQSLQTPRGGHKQTELTSSSFASQDGERSPAADSNGDGKAKTAPAEKAEQAADEDDESSQPPSPGAAKSKGKKNRKR
jgi:NhaP-type Na+/H+ or K+/H+ antiporter